MQEHEQQSALRFFLVTNSHTSVADNGIFVSFFLDSVLLIGYNHKPEEDITKQMLRSSQFDKPIVSFLTFLMSFQSEVLLWIYIVYFFAISVPQNLAFLSLSLLSLSRTKKIEKNSAMSRVSKM